MIWHKFLIRKKLFLEVEYAGYFQQNVVKL